MVDSPDIDTVLFDTMEAVSLGGCRIGSSKTDLLKNRERLAAGPVRKHHASADNETTSRRRRKTENVIFSNYSRQRL